MTTATDSQALLLRLLDPATRAHPYPIYHEIRAHGPLQLPEMNLVVFSSAEHCDEVLRHPASASDRAKSTAAQRRYAELAEQFPQEEAEPPSFLFLDPPDHTRLRRLVSKAFAPKVVRALEPEIDSLVDALLDAAGEPLDVVADLAYPLPVAVICRLLGVPVEDEPEFGRASAILAKALDPVFTFTGQAPESFDEMMAAGLWLREYLRDLIRKRRADPGDDLMSALISVEESGDQLTEAEIVSTCNLLLIAGHETTVNLIANAALAMLRHPQQWGALAADPSRASAVVEETLRYDPPVQLVSRIAAEDMTVGGVAVPRGDVMALLIAAANHDPAAVAQPDRFDPDREAIRHLGFGRGPHFCLGAPLARLEGTVALAKLTARFPHARLAAEPTYKPNLTLRGLASLSVATE
ncbi:cytochrome P450 [Mycolicibacterium flavescens]|uniref:Steroid C26-monooxygenase n=1 Tax=Mycolicibacterium flavescens TaxID=1776 RepID=A0A1E3R9A7_MYCFV|nr:cytochrome P450 [Mycolicibacterium flavescens]MCV7282945.1 cytochrome P450 [Mycolicibacterium flavescens]ODQ86515.1 cytochrome [Mycolicibacterium flavescens]